MSDTSRELEIFNFEGLDVRTLERDGEPWFYASDACAVLGLTNVNMALKTLDDDEADLTTSEVRSKNGVIQKREVWIVSESGLYELVFKSRRAEARAFRRWVRRDVIPAIRRTGQYVADERVRRALGLRKEAVTLSLEAETAADRYRWEAEELQEQLTNVLADRDKWRRAYYAKVCDHPKHEHDGSCTLGMGCSFYR